MTEDKYHGCCCEALDNCSAIATGADGSAFIIVDRMMMITTEIRYCPFCGKEFECWKGESE